MPYTAEQLVEMDAKREDWRERKQRLMRRLFAFNFTSDFASEMMKHGFSRRVSDLDHGIRRIFELIPPAEASPNQDAIQDATAYLQAFVINVFGSLDNLAWIWTREAGVTNQGRVLRRSQIGLTPDHTLVRATLSEATQRHLQEADTWFSYLEEYRHALAHRIPLYIPPRMLGGEEAAEFRRLETGMQAENWDWDEWHRVLAAQRALGRFEPMMMHSYGEGARPVRFHAQVISDFATVVQTGECVVADLQALRA